MNYIFLFLALGVSSELFKKKTKMQLPSFKGTIETVHEMAGRARFIIPDLQYNEEKKSVIETEMMKIPGIKLIKVSTITGSLLIEYDDSKIQPILLFTAVIKILGLEHCITADKSSALSREFQVMRDSINTGIYEKSNGLVDLKSILTLTLGVSAFYFLIADKNKLSSKFTLLWWFSQMIFKA